MTADSRTDLEALRRSGSGKILALAVVLLGALGAAGWFMFLRPQGIGNAEEAHKVLVVRAGEVAGYSTALDRGGFDAAEGEIDYWVDKARAELEEAPEGTDVQVVLTLADRFGYGFVVFEHPQQVDFSGVDLESTPPFDAHVRFAVLSVGDFASPHVMTVNPKPSEALRRLDINLLQALFAQAPLAEALPSNTSASVEAIQLRSKLEEAITDLQLVDAARELANEVAADAERVLSDERAKGEPVRLGETLESGRASPVPGGGVIVTSRAHTVTTDDGRRAELSAAPEESLWFHAKPGDDDRVLCESIGTGVFSALESARFTFSDDGAAVVVQTLTERERLWTRGPSGGCDYLAKGTLPETTLDDVSITLPTRGGFVARVGTSGGEASVELVAMDAAEPSTTLIELTGVALRDVAWISESTLAATGDDGSLYLVPAGTGSVLSVALTGVGRDPTLYEVARVSEDTLVLTVGSSPRQLVLVDAGRAWTDLFADPPALPQPDVDPATSDDAEPAPVPPVAIALDPTAFSTKILTRVGKATQPVASPDGSRVAFTVRDRALDDPGKGDDTEIAQVVVDSGAMELLTRNTLPDARPRYTTDGAWVLFETQVELPQSAWRLTVPRAVSAR
ncbi:MAG: TolB family protein [Nannocystaceae bacterium]|nr:hypothetical protein [bacterium]